MGRGSLQDNSSWHQQTEEGTRRGRSSPDNTYETRDQKRARRRFMETVRLHNAALYRYGTLDVSTVGELGDPGFARLTRNASRRESFNVQRTLQLARDCKYLSTTVKLEIGTEIFTTTGHSLLDPGYTSILIWQALGNNDTLPKFTPDERVHIQEVRRSRYPWCVIDNRIACCVYTR